MATPGRLMDTVANVTGANRSKVENIYDELRKSGDVPVGVRGRYGVSASSEAAAKLLIAVCCAEHVKDSPAAVRRYSSLVARLPSQPSFLHALTALIDGYVTDSNEPTSVFVTFVGPSPWAEARIEIETDDSRVVTDYSTLDGSPTDLIDATKQRQRRRVTTLGDIRTTVEVSDRTLSALGKLLRE